MKMNNKNKYLIYGINFGLLCGALLAIILGVFFDNLLIWGITPGFGMLVGLVIGNIIDSTRDKRR